MRSCNQVEYRSLSSRSRIFTLPPAPKLRQSYPLQNRCVESRPTLIMFCGRGGDDILLAGNDWTYHHLLDILVVVEQPCLPMRMSCYRLLLRRRRLPPWNMNAIAILRPTCNSVWKSSTSK